jgi:hypothetical protein
VFDQQNQHAMTEPMMKAWLADYRSQLEALQGDINATGEAAIALKPYLSPGSSNYATLTKNEEILQQYLKLYVDDYNRNADGYNVHWGMQYGNVSLL